MDDNQTGDFDIENESQIEIDCVFEIDWKSIFYGEEKENCSNTHILLLIKLLN